MRRKEAEVQVLQSFQVSKRTALGYNVATATEFMPFYLFWEIVSAFWTAVPILLSGQVLTNMVSVINSKVI